MTPQSWDQVKSIFGAAIEQEPQYREAYARAACQGDEALLREVLSLLTADSSATGLRNPFLQPQQTPLLKERYRIERELGRGGLGLVYLARDESLHGRRVVIKMPLDPSPEDPWLSDKFAAEVKALALIHHPGVVGALDSGATPDGRPFLVMQYVEGQSLRESIPEGGAPLPFAGEALRQIGHALGAAHARGIWHRDLKPANIMQQPLETGRIHLSLIDFGIASVTGPNVASGSTRIAGTPPYMSPEQLQGRVGAACDIFAMGVIAFELVTGRKPFAADDPVTLHQLHSAGAPNPAQWRPELPPEAARLILAALAFRPDDRPGSAADYGEALAGALTAPPAAAVVPPAPRRTALLAGAAALAVLLAGGAWWTFAGKPGGPGISWSLMVQPGGSGAASAVSPGAPLHTSDGFFLVVRAPGGYLYLLSDDPAADSLSALGSFELRAGEQNRIPDGRPFKFDEPGKLNLWCIWSPHTVAELEGLARLLNAQDRGVMADSAERKRIRQFVNSLPRGARTSPGTLRADAGTVAWRIAVEAR